MRAAGGRNVNAQPRLTKAEKTQVLDRLAFSDMFETFLANKYTAAKRFGLEGAESLIPGMKTIIDTAAELGVQDVVLGMPHRGASAQGGTGTFSLRACSCVTRS